MGWNPIVQNTHVSGPRMGCADSESGIGTSFSSTVNRQLCCPLIRPSTETFNDERNCNVAASQDMALGDEPCSNQPIPGYSHPEWVRKTSLPRIFAKVVALARDGWSERRWYKLLDVCRIFAAWHMQALISAPTMIS